jgi:sulfite reductase alpha subunit-like flavoprotein
MPSSPLYILYGSATGNAEQIAKDLAARHEAVVKQQASFFASVVCCELDQFKKHQSVWETPGPCKHALLIVASTTGNGDPPENASKFMRTIKRKTTPRVFEHCVYAVLGLGDTNYDQFCQTGKVIDKRVNELGGTRIKPLECADEGTGQLEQVVEGWTVDIVALAEKAVRESSKSGTEAAPESTDAGEVVSQVKDEVNTESATTTESKSEANVDDGAKGASNVKGADSGTEALQVNQDKSTVTSQTETNTATTAIESSTTNSTHINISPNPQTAPRDLLQTDSMKMDTPPSPLYILYGSATGNAEHIAKDLASTYQGLLKNKKAQCFFPSVVCCELDQFKKHLSTWQQEPVPGQTKHGVLVVASTTGNGDPPENASKFVRYFKRKSTSESRCLQHVAYAVLGLGDTNYDQFCQTGKTLDKKLEDAGGSRIQPLTCADEATGLEDAVEPWTATILVQVTRACQETPSLHMSRVQSTINAMIDAEEKKVDNEDINNNNNNKHDNNGNGKSETLSRGVSMIRALLKLNDKQPLPSIDEHSLPMLSSQFAKCTLVDKTNDSSDEQTRSDAALDCNEAGYSHKSPYEASIARSRYLTKTSKQAAQTIINETMDNYQRGLELLEQAFPLSECADCELNGKRVIEVTLSLPDEPTWEYKPGDSIGIVVENSPKAVNFILDMLLQYHNLDGNQMVSIDDSTPIPLQEAIRKRLDLCSPIKRRHALHSLSHFANDPAEVSCLHFLASKHTDAATIFRVMFEEQHFSIVDLLQMFPSTQRITLEGLFGILSSIPPRYYSICSSPLATKNKELSIAFSVVDYLTPSLSINGEEYGQRRVHGVATSYMEFLCSPLLCDGKSHVSEKLSIFSKPTEDFCLPDDLSKPMILIGPGTGIAPFMGFLSQRQAMSSETADKTSLGTVDVFFGCRHEKHDWLYQEELVGFAKSDPSIRIHTAFSRDDSNRQYIQDIMLNNDSCRKRLVDLILRDAAYIFICGDGNKMAKDVQAAIASLIGADLEGGLDEAKEYISNMKSNKRLVLDIWS